MNDEQKKYQPDSVEQKTGEAKLAIREVSSFDDLVREARGDIYDSERVIHNLRNLFERAKEADQSLFLVESGGTTFAVLSDNEQSLKDHQDQIDQLITFQGSVDANSLWGNCIYIHEFAAAMGFTDGNASASIDRNGDDDKSIYPIRGLHDVGWKKAGDQIIWVDFTSRPYVFSDLGDAGQSAYDGIIVIQNANMSAIDKVRGKKTAMQQLYQCNWRLDDFNPNDPLIDHVMQTGREKFLKQSD